jgi:hypothetical protein
MNYSFGNNMQYMQQDYNKPQNNQAGGDMFNSPWNNFGRSNFLEANNELREQRARDVDEADYAQGVQQYRAARKGA